MDIYETVIKALASLGKETINELGEAFVKNYSDCQYISYENMLNVVNYIKKYLPDLFTEEDEKYYKIFGQIYFKVEMERWSNSNIYIQDEAYNENNFTTANCSNTECLYDCENCNIFCEAVPIFFIDIFYDFCLNSEVVKNFLRTERENIMEIEGENIMKDKEFTQKSNDLRKIAKNFVENHNEYRQIIANLYNLHLKDEIIINVIYEILKNIK